MSGCKKSLHCLNTIDYINIYININYIYIYIIYIINININILYYINHNQFLKLDIFNVAIQAIQFSID